ncbi:MAG: TIGR01777 family oxidoreductase [Gemmataceae bacterium]
MRIVIPGGSGQIGTLLARAFRPDHEVIVLSRHSTPAPWRVAPWDGATLGPWVDVFEDADVVINLAGRSVNCRYNAANRAAIKDSRVSATRAVGAAIARVDHPPRVWLQASTATIYAHRYDAPNHEQTGLLGGTEGNVPDTWRFSIDVARSWEEACLEAATPRTRKILLRSAMVMSPDRGGVFDAFLGLVRKRFGGKQGNGRQFVSWIHDRDFIRAVSWLIEHDLAGPVNIAAPNPLPNAEFMRTLRQAWGVRLGVPAPRWLLEIGAFFMRTETELILKSRRVIPGRLLEAGFRFDFPTWRDAAVDLCARYRGNRPSAGEAGGVGEYSEPIPPRS